MDKQIAMSYVRMKDNIIEKLVKMERHNRKWIEEVKKKFTKGENEFVILKYQGLK